MAIFIPDLYILFYRRVPCCWVVRLRFQRFRNRCYMTFEDYRSQLKEEEKCNTLDFIASRFHSLFNIHDFNACF